MAIVFSIITPLERPYFMGMLGIPVLLGPILGPTVGGYLVEYSNWRMIFRGGDYFAATAPPSPLQHTWSLGIEEQFYLLWPLLVVLALRVRRWRGLLLGLCGAGIVASGAACALLYRPDTDPSRSYYGTDTRAGALLVGCGLALLLAGRDRRLPGWLALPAAAGVGLAWATADGAAGWLYRGGLTAIAVGVALVLGYLVTRPAGLGARLLGVPPLAWLGRLSYGVYLWHLPVFLAVNREMPKSSNLVCLIVAISLTAAFTAFSWLAVERPCQRMKGGTRRHVVASVPAAT